MHNMPNQYDEYTIDVIIPVYNGERYIERALKSVIGQTYPPSKIILIDDGSTDRTVDIIDMFKRNNSNLQGVIIEIYKGNHGGPSAARNIGLRNSKSDYIAFLDADDEWYPSKLEEQIKLFKKPGNEKVGLVYCCFEIKDNTNNNKYPVILPKISDYVSGYVFQKMLLNNSALRSPTLIMVKKCVIENVGLFDEKIIGVEDWDFIIKVTQKYEIDYASQMLATIWSEPASLSKQHKKMLIAILRLYKKWKKYYSVDTRNEISKIIIYSIFNLSFFPKIPTHRKSIIGKLRKEFARPITVDILCFFIYQFILDLFYM